MKNNIRELEDPSCGSAPIPRSQGQAITLEMAKNVLRDLIGDKRRLSIEDIQEAVGSKYHVKCRPEIAPPAAKNAGSSPPDPRCISVGN